VRVGKVVMSGVRSHTNFSTFEGKRIIRNKNAKTMIKKTKATAADAY
jgi:hypothetical protein